MNMYGPTSIRTDMHEHMNAWAFLRDLCLCTARKWRSIWEAEFKIHKLCSQKETNMDKEETMGTALSAEKSLSTWLRWNYSKGFKIATYYPWILRSEYVLVIKSYDKEGKWVSQSTDLLGQVSFSCLASPFVSVLSLSSWHLTKAQNDRQLLMTS